MSSSSLTRREFVRRAALAAAAAQLFASSRAAASPVSAPAAPLRLPPGAAPVRWLDGKTPGETIGNTWGVSWPRGQYPRDTKFALRAVGGEAVPVQSWPTAYWPDGSLKWTAHAVPADAKPAEAFELSAGEPALPSRPLTTTTNADTITVATGVIEAVIARRGDVLVKTIRRDGRDVLKQGRLVLQRQDKPDAGVAIESFTGRIEKVTVEQAGPVRAVIKIEGRHAAVAGTREWLPFIVRLYFYAGGEAVRMVHTIVHDGDEQKDFIRGLGVRFEVPMRGALYDRHVRFSGQDAGLFAEAVQGITGLRRDPGVAVREAQVAGRATPPLETWSPAVSQRLQYVPAFGDWTLFQSTADGFEIRKRTREGFTWIGPARGQRAGGLGYVGTPQGGAAFGVRHFWESYPAQFDLRGATTAEAEVTMWLWAPEAGAMDLRGYHDDMGEDTYAKQTEALEITYEDYEPGFDRPEGVARTSELFLWALAATPTRERLVELAGVVREPPVLLTTPAHLHLCQVFDGLWAPVDRSTPARAAVEDQLDWYFDFYHGQREQRRWYGFWNFGDVVHTYDADRHEWRYDVGGFGWDNSELSTDLWLWLFFLRTGRADVFRFAEAMTRHTGEVDVHHLGRFAPLGSRHNVLHWGCSAKQLRISTAANRRYYYYLTADERVGDLMREQIEAVRALVRIQPGRKLPAARHAGDLARETPSDADHAGVGFGTDWGAISAAWLTEWERTGDPKIRDRLVASMRTIGQQPRGFFTGAGIMDLDTGAFAISKSDKVSVSHLSAVFGLVEVCAELIQLLDVPEFKKAWLDYCELYNASPEEQQRRLGQPLHGLNLQQGHSRLTAYAAKLTGNPALAKRAWREFFRGQGGIRRRGKLAAVRVTGPAVLRPVDEADFVSTNATAQWGLAAMECLAVTDRSLPANGD
ncbi:Tat pathway signal sequence domain protein [Horticoccus luteus]|uniref:Tat pathway signal sequence domain protein n=1 Tax=Horticoccus luteus TaxID=2862869 RepID=A0A8F9TR96_9BACT|nr:Tat pathway signal sequence domain protein [Horticoccus luteus]QYM77729.1 Tat pathway signal sequence domain protein [Horticoccus luteus]